MSECENCGDLLMTIEAWMSQNTLELDLEIDRVERIDSTRLKIDGLDRSTRLQSILSIDSDENRSTRSIDSTRFPLFIGLLIFRCAISVEQCVFHRYVCLSVTTICCARGYQTTRRHADSRDHLISAKTTGRIELQFGVLIGFGQCHFVLDGVPSQIGRP